MSDATPSARPETAATVRPTPRWWGAACSLMLLASALWFFGYTLLDIPWQQSLGAWNYLIGFGIMLVTVLMFRAWRGDPKDGWEPGPSYVEQLLGDVREIRVFLGKILTRY